MLKISQIQTFTQNQTFFRPLLTYKTEFRLAENSNQTGRPASYIMTVSDINHLVILFTLIMGALSAIFGILSEFCVLMRFQN